MEIPLFPLNTVLFPGAPLPLRVFEPRYRAMMADLLGDDIPDGPGGPPDAPASFAVARIREGLEVGGRADTHDVGSLASVEWVRVDADGTIDLLVRGARRFRIERRLPDDPYPLIEATVLGEPPGARADEALRFAQLAAVRYGEAVALLLRSEPEEVALPDDPVAASYVFAASLSVELHVLQMLLEIPTASERLVRAATIARAEANLLSVVGPPARRPTIEAASLN